MQWQEGLCLEGKSSSLVNTRDWTLRDTLEHRQESSTTSRSSVDPVAQPASHSQVHSLLNTCAGKLRQMTANLPGIWGWGSRIGKEQKGVTITRGQMEILSLPCPDGPLLSACILTLPVARGLQLTH